MLVEKTAEVTVEKSKTEESLPLKTRKAPTKRKVDPKRGSSRGGQVLREPEQDKPDMKRDKKKNHNQEIGLRGEEAALRFLERRGFEILDRNWSCRSGEVDIVAEDGDALVFVEVKTRSNCEHGLPEEAVDAAKRKRYEKIAGYYLRDHDVVDKSVRFDVISILVVAPERAFLRHHRDAFAL